MQDVVELVDKKVARKSISECVVCIVIVMLI